ncbi:MAG: serine protease [Betaproteobacteria bacterium]|nr:MAG: serine protease [Betaproteobacteria bacterium]
MAGHATTVSLVLGSGGARGLAHIGVIQWLVENGYRIHSIAGSSMGALVGGIYAAGKLKLYTDWVCTLERMDVLRLLDPSFGRAGLFKGDRLIGVLRKLIGDCAIEALPMAYTAVATDLESGREVRLREGRLFDAIRASIAVPLIFTPFEHGGRRLLDGGLVNPIPVDATLDDATDLTVAVDLNSRGQADRRAPGSASPTVSAADRQGMLDVAFASMDTMQNTITRLKVAACSPDITVRIPRDACAFHEFWRAKEMIALGRERTARTFAAISSVAAVA